MTETGSRVVQRVEHDKIEILPFEFSFGILLLVVRFEGKAYQQLVFSFDSPPDWRQYLWLPEDAASALLLSRA